MPNPMLNIIRNTQLSDYIYIWYSPGTCLYYFCFPTQGRYFSACHQNLGRQTV